MRQNVETITRIHLLGLPGAGKDTCACILKDMSKTDITKIISTGDIFRGATTPDGEYGCYYFDIKPFIESTNNGHYIPDETIVDIVNREIKKRQQENFSRFIFTGYPRTLGQLQEIKKTPQNDFYISLDCTEENAKKRIEKRYQKNLAEGKTTRADDLPEKFPNRLNQYQTLTVPVINELNKRGTLITLDTNGTVLEATQEIKRRITF